MNNLESVQDFYNTFPENIRLPLPIEISGVGHFNVFPRWRCTGTYLRRDFYKIVLVIGTGILYYGDKEIMIDRSALFFTNPIVPYAWEPISEKQDGWLCLFTEEFIQSQDQVTSEQAYPVLYMEEIPVFFLDDNELKESSFIFEKMIEEMSSDYIYKYSVLRNYLQLLIHSVQKLHPQTGVKNLQTDAVHRTTFQFLTLLEQQFPIESPDNPLVLKNVQDYAQRLSIHPNHLNHSVKQVTNKTSSQIIAARIAREAKALLQNTDWNISEIAYALGFEYPSHFTNFFRKNTGFSPKEVRAQII